MLLPDRKVLLGITLGALSGVAAVMIGPGAVIAAVADSVQTGIDPSALVKYEGRDYDVQYDDGVDTTPIRKMRIKKVEFGRVSYVDISRTSTGTYSTDAMFSDKIQYPGITVREVPSSAVGAISALGLGGRWVALALAPGNSFVHVRSGDHAVLSGGGQTCVFTRSVTSC